MAEFSNDDAITRSKRVMEAVDKYVDLRCRLHRTDLRVLLMDEFESLIARIRALESASQPGSGEAWQPIETAPKGGTEIALLFGEDADIVGRHQPRVRAALWCGDWSIPYYRSNPPTHWMPLPAAPSAGNGEAKGGGNG